MKLVKNIFHVIASIPNLLQAKFSSFQKYIADFKYRLTHLAESNFEVGMYHLKRGNLNDAIMRFKLVDKFFDPHNSTINYWLGVSYYLKNHFAKARNYFEKTKDQDGALFRDFLQNYDKSTIIPFPIWQVYRDLVAQRIEIINPIFQLDNITAFVKIIIANITKLPENYRILEIGCNSGIMGEKIKTRFPDKAVLTGLEYSKQILDNLENSASKYYDEMILAQDYQFLNEKEEKFDIILTCSAISYTKDLEKLFSEVGRKLNIDGYFAACIRLQELTGFSQVQKEFCYNYSDILDALANAGLKLLYEERMLLSKNDSCLIFVSKKGN